MASSADLWGDMPTIKTGQDYVDSLRGRGTRLFLMGERIAEPADHPMIVPSINAMRATYDLAVEHPEIVCAFDRGMLCGLTGASAEKHSQTHTLLDDGYCRCEVKH